MNGLLGLHCYSAAAKRSAVDSVPAQSPAGESERGVRPSDAWWNPLRARLLRPASHA
jgi:hypothetical protein